MAPTFRRPSSVTHITNTFAQHKARGSANPGTDYGAPTGTNVVMPANGMVTHVAWSNLVGWWLHIDFDNGWGADLLHNSKILVKAGTWHRAGDHIAESGGTGSVATGPHIHMSLRPRHGAPLQNAGNVDPEKYMAAAPDQFLTWLGQAYLTRLRLALGLKDGKAMSAADRKVLQKKVGTPADGVWGPNSNKALQKFVGVTVDGSLSTSDIAAWKKAIDAGKFGVVPPAAIMRTTGKTVVNVRPTPATTGKVASQLKASTAYVVTGYVRGEKVSGNDVWFVLANGAYAWSGGFTSTSTTGLPDKTVATPPVTGPTQAEYDSVRAQLATALGQVTDLTAKNAALTSSLSTAQAGLTAALAKIAAGIAALSKK